MQRTLIKKLQSNQGASLMVALLLFLVCAAVGAVILAAAAATAGRMSEKAKMDQRYYSVSSAAELLADQLCGKEVKIERVRTTTATSILTVNGTDVQPGTPVVQTEYKTYLNRTNVNDPAFTGDTDNLSFLSNRALMLLYGSNLSSGFNTEDAMQYTFSNAETGGTISLTHGDGYSDLDVSGIEWTMKSNGTLELKISAGEENNRYSIVLTLVPEINESAKTLEEPPVTALDPATDQFIRTSTTTTTKTSTVKWKVGGIIKEVS